jgi:hypothetical protein
LYSSLSCLSCNLSYLSVGSERGRSMILWYGGEWSLLRLVDFYISPDQASISAALSVHAAHLYLPVSAHAHENALRSNAARCSAVLRALACPWFAAAWMVDHRNRLPEHPLHLLLRPPLRHERHSPLALCVPSTFLALALHSARFSLCFHFRLLLRPARWPRWRQGPWRGGRSHI